MIAVLDASAAAEILLHKPSAGLISDWLGRSDRVVAPDIYIAEITNTFLKYQQAHHLSPDACLEAIQEGIGLIDEYADGQNLWREAFFEGVRLKVPVYDMFYLVTTRRNDGRLLTMDRKLIGLCKKSGLRVAE